MLFRSMLDEGVTTLTHFRYSFSSDLIDHAAQSNHAQCDEDVRKLIALNNIQSDVFSNLPMEIRLLEDHLLPEATSRYTSRLQSGETAAYKAAVAGNSADVMLKSILRAVAGETSAARNELEYYIDALCARRATEGAISFVDQRLTLTTSTFGTGIPNDAFSSSANGDLSAHIDFLTTKRRTLERSVGGNEMDALMAQKKDLQTQRLSALDNDDLAGAKALEEKLFELEESIRGLESQSAAKLSALNTEINSLQKEIDSTDDQARRASLQSSLAQAQAQKSLLESSLSSGSLGTQASQLKSDAIRALNDNDAAGLLNAVDGLMGLLPTDPTLVLPAAQEVYNQLSLAQSLGSGAGGANVSSSMRGPISTALSTIEAAVLENPNVQAYDSRSLSPSELSDLFARFDAENDLGSTGDSVMMVALELLYQQTGNPNAQALASSLATNQRNFGEDLAYLTVDSTSGEYIPLTAIRALTGRRYVWNESKSMGVLAQGADYYSFTMFSETVQRSPNDANSEVMARAAESKGGLLYIPEEYAYERFGVRTVGISGTDMGCIYNDELMDSSLQLLSLFLSN